MKYDDIVFLLSFSSWLTPLAFQTHAVQDKLSSVGQILIFLWNHTHVLLIVFNTEPNVSPGQK